MIDWLQAVSCLDRPPRARGGGADSWKSEGNYYSQYFPGQFGQGSQLVHRIGKNSIILTMICFFFKVMFKKGYERLNVKINQ